MILPVYLGRIEVFGLSVQGKPPFVPLISQEMFYGAQQALKPKQMPKAYDRDNPGFPLRGTLKCSCGALFCGAWSHGRHKRYPYYRCKNCRNRNMAKDSVESDFMEELATKRLSARDRQYLLDFLKDCWQDQTKQRDIAKSQLEKDLSNLRAVQSAIVRKNALGIISDDLTRQELQDLESELASKSLQLRDLEPMERIEDEVVDFGLRFLRDLPQLWQSSGVTERKALQRFAFPSGTTYMGIGQMRTAKTDPLPQVRQILFTLQSSTVLRPQSNQKGDGRARCIVSEANRRVGSSEVSPKEKRTRVAQCPHVDSMATSRYFVRPRACALRLTSSFSVIVVI